MQVFIPAEPFSPHEFIVGLNRLAPVDTAIIHANHARTVYSIGTTLLGPATPEDVLPRRVHWKARIVLPRSCHDDIALTIWTAINRAVHIIGWDPRSEVRLDAALAIPRITDPQAYVASEIGMMPQRQHRGQWHKRSATRLHPTINH